MYGGVGSILGGLPVYAFIASGKDGFTGEYWSEVQSIHWLKKGDLPGSEIPQSVFDRAAGYDPYFSSLIDTVNTWYDGRGSS